MSTATVTLSESFDLHVPDEIRKALNLKAGDQFQVSLSAGQIEFLPVTHPRELRGILRGADVTMDEHEDRF